jgi:hypothetical protein
MIDTIQVSKFAYLHNGSTVIFCATHFLPQEFQVIKNLKNDIILISGNSDHVVDYNLFNLKPNNVKKWYAQNPMLVNDILQPIPIGIENYLPCVREGHGDGWGDRVRIKQEKIDFYENKIPTKFIYSNFNVNTNPYHRTIIRKICIDTEFIDWEEPNLSVESFFEKLLDYEAVVCAQGNGPGDNHRIYETLYMDRIPITFNKVMYDNLHHLFPVVLLENYEELTNYETMRNKINDAKNKNWDKSLLEMPYWINNIINGNNQI